jgi:hypothetical protein
MSRWLKTVLLINLLLCLAYVYANYAQWEVFRGNNPFKSTITSSAWNPFSITVFFHFYNDGVFSTLEGPVTYINSPFLLFGVSTIANIALMIWILRKMEKNIS